MADPVADLIRMTRAAMLAAGFERHEEDGMVWFAGGSGSPVVLVHGVNDQAGTWAAVARALIAKHRVIVPDLAGHGESEPSAGPIGIGLIVEKLAFVIDAAVTGVPRPPHPPSAPSPPVGRRVSMERSSRETRIETLLPSGEKVPKADEGHGVGSEVESITLIGNSMGAWIAILYALQHPERVARLVLESGGGLDRPLAVPLVATNRGDALTILRAVHGPNAALPEWTVDALLARANGSPMLRLTGMAESYVDARLGELRVPTTIVWGRHDGVITRDYVDALQSRIAGATLEVIEDAAHIPHAQQPERFLACLPAIS